jgi:hypothetical protein
MPQQEDNSLNNIITKLDNLDKEVKKSNKGLLGDLSNGIDQVSESITSGITNIGDSFTKSIKAPFKGVSDSVKSMKKGITEPFKKAKEAIKSPLQSVGKLFGGKGQSDNSNLIEPLQNIDSSIKANSEVLKGISNNITELWADISEPIKGTFGVLSEIRDNSEGDVLQERENRKEELALQKQQIQALNSVSNNSENLVTKSEEQKKGLLSAFKGKTAKMTGAGGSVMGGIGKGIGKGISGLLKGLGKGLKAISNPKFLIGASVLIALGGAMFISAKAFQMFSDIDWAGVGIGIGVLTLLTAAAFGLSAIAPAIFIGAAAIAALGASMIPAAFAFDLFGSALEKMSPFIFAFGAAVSAVIGAVGDFLTGFIDNLIGLSSVGPGLLVAATGIGAISAALIAFGASSALGGILSFFGGDPIKKFIELGKVGDGLDKSAKSIDAMAASLEKLDSDKIKDVGKAFKPLVKELKNLSKLDLEDAGKLFQFMTGSRIGGSLMTSAAPMTSAIPALNSNAQNMYGQITDDSVAAASAFTSGQGIDSQVEENLIRALSKGDSSVAAARGRKKLYDLKRKAETGEISPEKLENIIANLLIKAAAKGGKLSKKEIGELNAIHKDNVLLQRQVEPANISTGAELDIQQRQNDQMREDEALSGGNNNQGSMVVNRGGDQNNVTNTTIAAPPHKDRTSQWSDAAAYSAYASAGL